MKLPRLIGVIHLPALPGALNPKQSSPRERLEHAHTQALHEVKLFERAGFEGVILENYGDSPFYKDRVPAETVSAMSILAAAVKDSTKLSVGVNILRNDAFSALAVASVTGCDFIRVNVLSGVVATDQGLIEGRAADLLRERERIGSEVAILADVHVKHAQTLSSSHLGQAISDVASRGGADAVIVTGRATSQPTDPEDLKTAKTFAARAGVPFYIGSGSSPEALPELIRYTPYLIVGSTLRKGGKAGETLMPKQVQSFAKLYSKLVKSKTK